MTLNARPTSSSVAVAAGQAEAHLDDLALALRQRRQRLADVLLAQRFRRQLERRGRGLVLDEVAELGLLLLADRLLERDRLLAMRRMSRTSRERALELGGDLLGVGSRPSRLDQLALDVHDLVELLDHVDRDADGAALVGDRPGHRLADPPRRVGRELVAAAVVELLDRADQARASPPGSGPGTSGRGRGSPSRSRRPGADSPRPSPAWRPCRPARCAWPATPPARPSAARPRPIERRYRRSESRLGSTVRSISGFGAIGGLRRPRTAASMAASGSRACRRRRRVDALARRGRSAARGPAPW